MCANIVIVHKIQVTYLFEFVCSFVLTLENLFAMVASPSYSILKRKRLRYLLATACFDGLCYRFR